MTSKVSFIVPCYKLAHYLSECVTSILNQSFHNLEVIIMDDCSPDNTPEVAASFKDPRIRYIRNETNLGHLRNYNKGIELTRGRFVWVISADDSLRRPYVVERYVQLMQAYLNVGYVFCPNHVIFENTEVETKIATIAPPPSPEDWPYYNHGVLDTIFTRNAIMSKLCRFSCVSPPSTIVRKECYDKLGMFRLDMPQMGDWYLFSLFALHYDVGYLAEPMVNYRIHTQNMNFTMSGSVTEVLDLALLHLRISREALTLGQTAVAKEFESWLNDDWFIGECASRLIANKFENHEPNLSSKEFERILLKESGDSLVGRRIIKRVNNWQSHICSVLGDRSYEAGEREQARRYLAESIRLNPGKLKTMVKWLAMSARLR